jgi:hypothetical protein
MTIKNIIYTMYLEVKLTSLNPLSISIRLYTNIGEVNTEKTKEIINEVFAIFLYSCFTIFVKY